MRTIGCIFILVLICCGLTSGVTIGIAEVLGNESVSDDERKTVTARVVQNMKLGTAVMIDVGSLSDYRVEGADAKSAFREMRRQRQTDYCYTHRIVNDGTSYRYAVNVIDCESVVSVFKKQYSFTSLDALAAALSSMRREIASRMNLGKTSYQEARERLSQPPETWDSACTNAVAELDDLERSLLYSTMKRPWSTYSTLNTLVGFGIASYAQGDILGGVIITLLHAGTVGSALYVAYYLRPLAEDHLIQSMSGGYFESNTYESAYEAYTREMGTASTYLAIALVAGLSGYIIGVIAPIIFAESYNGKLHELLKPVPSVFSHIGANTTPYCCITPTSMRLGLSYAF